MPERLLLFLLCIGMHLNVNAQQLLPALQKIPEQGYITSAMVQALFGGGQITDEFPAIPDTLGRFYKDPHSGLITGCIQVFMPAHDFEYHVLFNATVYNGRLQITETCRLLHGNYSCCWNNAYDGFTKEGDLFCVKQCTTGSAFCSGNRIFFRAVRDLNPANSFLSEMYAGDDDGAVTTIWTEIRRRKDTLLADYSYRNLVWLNDTTLHGIDSAFFTVPFLYQNNRLQALDSTLLRRYGIDW